MRSPMKILAALALAFTLAGCQTLSGGGDGHEFVNDDDFRSWFAFYYKAPHPERVTASLRFMKRHKYLDEYPDIASIFLSHVMAANPDRIPGWLDTEWRDLGETEWSVILIALWMSDTKDSRALIGRYLDRAEPAHRSRIRDLQDQTPEHIDPLKTEIVDPRQINLVWAAFSATGDERYVRRVIDEVHNYGAVRNETEAAIGEAAIMTLANNALQHDVVAKLCDRLDNTHPDAKTRILLKAMLNALADVAKENGIDLPAH